MFMSLYIFWNLLIGIVFVGGFMICFFFFLCYVGIMVFRNILILKYLDLFMFNL